ncbi:MAG: type III-A CRISPR-associated RAMP protein Csm3 [Candidatus Omnitrophica bacterium]|nr:type III-A CRISPR-associated RAMP protein Csm3 [Candidatus Omnitrophota bacterium]
MYLKNHIVLKGIIKCETGLHIGGSADQIDIGGVDLPVIKHPITKEPYIPGSSLKGKMRAMLEIKYKKISDRGDPCGCAEKDCFICKIFGPHKKPNHGLGPTRILVRDAYLTEKSRQEFRKTVEQGRDYLEKKTENSINRLNGSATPRSRERVPAGTEFDMEIVLLIFDQDNEKEFKDKVSEGLELIEETYLGGSGSRGDGKVSFEYKWEEEPLKK